MSFISEGVSGESEDYYSDSDYSGVEDFSVHEDTGWEDYANRSGMSGIDEYELDPSRDIMKVRFKNGSKTYDYPFADYYARLAKGGWGLNRTLNYDRKNGGYRTK